MIVQLSPEMDKIRKRVTELYIDKLKNSQVARLGYYFVKDIYFGELLKNNNFRCDVFLADNDVAGFIAYTENTRRLFSDIYKKSVPSVIGALLNGMARNPLRVLGGVLQNIYFVIFRGTELNTDIEAESLSMVIDDKYKLKTDLKIANQLYRHMFENLYNKGVPFVKSMVQSDNIFSRALNNYFKMKTAFKGKIISRSLSHDSIIYIGETAIGKDIL